jgi:hypothetical protein
MKNLTISNTCKHTEDVIVNCIDYESSEELLEDVLKLQKDYVSNDKYYILYLFSKDINIFEAFPSSYLYNGVFKVLGGEDNKLGVDTLRLCLAYEQEMSFKDFCEEVKTISKVSGDWLSEVVLRMYFQGGTVCQSITQKM